MKRGVPFFHVRAAFVSACSWRCKLLLYCFCTIDTTVVSPICPVVAPSSLCYVVTCDNMCSFLVACPRGELRFSPVSFMSNPVKKQRMCRSCDNAALVGVGPGLSPPPPGIRSTVDHYCNREYYHRTFYPSPPRPVPKPIYIYLALSFPSSFCPGFAPR